MIQFIYKTKITLAISTLLIAWFTYLGLRGERLWDDHSEERSGPGNYAMHHK